MACECDIVGLISNTYPSIISASLNGSTTVELSDEGVVLLGNTINTLSISAYAFLPGENKYLGASCSFSAQVSLPWVIKEDCIAGNVYFVPRIGASASIINGDAAGVSVVSLLCDPGLSNNSIDMDASSGPTSLVKFTDRKDGYGLSYTGVPFAIDTSASLVYVLNLGFISIERAYLQNFSISIEPPRPATVQYTFTFVNSN